jgi:hypothetical protein
MGDIGNSFLCVCSPVTDPRGASVLESGKYGQSVFRRLPE